MFQTTVEVDGMACSMCEAHINDTIRSEFPVEKVSSSHSKGRTVILSKEPLDEKALRAAIEGTVQESDKAILAAQEEAQKQAENSLNKVFDMFGRENVRVKDE